jgi:FkbM family methyltransferase
MSLMANMVRALKDFDRKVWPAHRIVLNEAQRAVLQSRKVIVADVGAADGPEERWLGVKELVKFLTFEPNPRPDVVADESTVNFPIGLWSSKEKRKLYLTALSDASSLLPVNEAAFADFQVKEGMRVVGEIELSLDTFDNCIAAKPELSPDFLKVDVEGVELEVLRGSPKALEQTVLGIRVETRLERLWHGAPLLWETNEYLREKGFVLFHLGRVHWVRENGVQGFTSQPQVIWGDAVYFLRREEFLKRLAALPEKEREPLLARYLVILLSHGVHDYAWELIEAVEQAGHITASAVQDWKESVKSSAHRSAFYFLWQFVGVNFALLVWLGGLLVPPARQRATFYFKQRLGRLSYELWRWCSRGGAPLNSTIDDPFV